jgi:uncharacterized membrane protein YkoI
VGWAAQAPRTTRGEHGPQAGISLAAAIAALGAASGPVGEVDLEVFAGTLVFTVDIGNQDVHVDAARGAVLSVSADEHLCQRSALQGMSCAPAWVASGTALAV